MPASKNTGSVGLIYYMSSPYTNIHGGHFLSKLYVDNSERPECMLPARWHHMQHADFLSLSFPPPRARFERLPFEPRDKGTRGADHRFSRPPTARSISFGYYQHNFGVALLTDSNAHTVDMRYRSGDGPKVSPATRSPPPIFVSTRSHPSFILPVLT